MNTFTYSLLILVLKSTMVFSTEQINIHCRNNEYTKGVSRFNVPTENVSWEVPWDEYDPPYFTLKSVLYINRTYADPEAFDGDFKPRWNSMDGLINRTSYTGNYSVVDGYPRNPVGRTGLRGRGELRRWGPNHEFTFVITRWKRMNTPKYMLPVDRNFIYRKFIHRVSHLYVLQFLGKKEAGKKKKWFFPGDIIRPGMSLIDSMKRLYGKQFVRNTTLEKRAYNVTEVAMKLNEFFKNYTILEMGYVDDLRNTDNAWVERITIHLHDEEGKYVSRLPLRAKYDDSVVHWEDLFERRSRKWYKNHKLLKVIAKMYNATWEIITEKVVKPRTFNL